MPFNYVKVPKSKNELSHVHVGQKRPYTQKIRSLGQKQAILVFLGFQKRYETYVEWDKNQKMN
jgi:hypothetical protein